MMPLKKKKSLVDFIQNFVRVGIYNTFISDFAIQEINQTVNEEKRTSLLKVIDDNFY